MSFTETIKGAFQKVDLQGKSMQDYAKEILIARGKQPEPKEDYVEYLLDEYYDEYFICDNCLYKIIEQESLDSECYCKISSNDNKTFSFITSFYNGGTCLNEMLFDAIRAYPKVKNMKLQNYLKPGYIVEHTNGDLYVLTQTVHGDVYGVEIGMNACRCIALNNLDNIKKVYMVNKPYSLHSHKLNSPHVKLVWRAPTVELTIKEIAAKFGYTPDQIKIINTDEN